MMLAFLCLFSLQRSDRWPASLLKMAGFCAGLAVAIATGSRTGWTMAPFLGLLWILTRPWMEGRSRKLLGLTVLAVAMLGLSWGSTVVHQRLSEVVIELRQYQSGEFVDSPTGTRLSLFRAAWAAFLAKPLAGWGFATLPTAADLPGTSALWTPVMTGYFVNNGTHNEWLQALMKMGLFGLVSRIFMYLVPLALFIQAVRSNDMLRQQAGYLGLVVVIGYLASGMTSEVSNLIYLSSFYGLMMAGLGAMALPPPGANR
jgi:O-antigen ligase